MSESAVLEFYSSKPRLIHMGVNIWLAPVLLYLVGIWPWPPSLVHVAVFVITGVFAVRFVRQRWDRPRLVISDEGITFGVLYARDAIRRVQPVLRSLKLILVTDEGMSEKVISLGWASNEDFKIIVSEAQRFNHAT